MQELREVYEGNLRLDESVRRPGILGVVEGIFFVANKPSRNGRLYPAELWENVLRSESVRRLLENRLMLGTVGHEDVDLDALIREQKVSHVVTDLKLNSDGTGWGRAEILDTPVGRILFNLLKSGSKLSVSSKGWGEYKGVTQEGIYEVDPQQYILERFDFVVDPGFLEAQPRLKEAYESLIKRKENREEVNKMGDFEVILKEKMMLQKELNEALDKIKELEREKEKLKEELEKQEGGVLGEEVRKILKEDFGLEEKVAAYGLKKIVKGVERLGMLLERMGVRKEEIEGEDVGEVLSNITRILREAFRKVKLGEDKDKGEEERFKYALKRIISLREENKRLRDLLYEARKVMRKVSELGGIEKIEKALNDAYKLVLYVGDRQLKEAANDIANRFGVEQEEAKEMIKKMGLRKAEETLSKIGEAKKKGPRVVPVEKIDEDVDEERISGRALKKYFRVEE